MDYFEIHFRGVIGFLFSRAFHHLLSYEVKRLYVVIGSPVSNMVRLFTTAVVMRRLCAQRWLKVFQPEYR